LAEILGRRRTVSPTRDRIQVLWMGRNNYYQTSQVVSDVTACAAYVLTGRVIVLSVVNAEGEGVGTTAYNEIIQLDSELAALPGIQYIDVRSLLVASYDPSNPQDVTDHANDIPPTSLRYDNLHYNNAGYAIVAKAVADRIKALGW